MHTFWTYAFAALLMTATLTATPTFPHLSLYDLKGGISSLPSGNREVVFVGRTAKARQALAGWYQAFCDHSEALRGLTVTVVPVFPTFMSNKFLRLPLMALLRRRVPAHMESHVGVLFSNADEMESLFSLPKEEWEQLRIFLVDEQGGIRWAGCGGPSAQAVRQLKQFIPKHVEKLGLSLSQSSRDQTDSP